MTFPQYLADHPWWALAYLMVICVTLCETITHKANKSD